MDRKKAWLLILLLAVLAGFIIFENKPSSATRIPVEKYSGQTVSPLPSSTPFYDMTVPYLRSREYASSMGTLEEIGSNNSYTTYLTSYTSDGLKVNALLTQPAGEKPVDGWPAIVFIHGYIPPTQWNTTTRYIDYVDTLAGSGFVVFKIDLRGHGESEGKPGGAYYSSDYVIDALNAYAALQSADFVNKNKIGMWGHSMAGNIVSRALAAKPDIPAAVIWAGAGFSYIDLRTYNLSDASYQPQPTDFERQRRRQQLWKLYGDPKDGNPFWKTVAATSYLTDLKGALQLHHAEDDATVNINYSKDLKTALDKAGVTNEYYEYTDGGHNIQGSSFSTAIERTVDFYKKYLL